MASRSPFSRLGASLPIRPNAKNRAPGGRGPRAAPSTIPVDTGEQLLELCRIRYDEKVWDLDASGLRLWFSGYSVSSDAVRRGLIQAGDLARLERAGRLLAARRGDASGSPTDAVGTAAGALLGPLLALGVVDRPKDAADVSVGVADYVEQALGRAPEAGPDRSGQEALGRLGGLSSTETAQLPFVATLWNPAHVSGKVETATDEELLAAREAARFIVSMLPETALPPLVRQVSRSALQGLVAVAMVVLRAYPLAAEALEAHAPALAKSGAPGLRYLR